jgi:hypothetical protein
MGWEYRRVTWDEVCELGPQGWRLVAVPPMPEMKAMLGQVQMTGVVLYHMEREAAEAGLAAQQDRAGHAGRSLWSGTEPG